MILFQPNRFDCFPAALINFYDEFDSKKPQNQEILKILTELTGMMGSDRCLNTLYIEINEKLSGVKKSKAGLHKKCL